MDAAPASGGGGGVGGDVRHPSLEARGLRGAQAGSVDRGVWRRSGGMASGGERQSDVLGRGGVRRGLCRGVVRDAASVLAGIGDIEDAGGFRQPLPSHWLCQIEGRRGRRRDVRRPGAPRLSVLLFPARMRHRSSVSALSS